MMKGTTKWGGARRRWLARLGLATAMGSTACPSDDTGSNEDSTSESSVTTEPTGSGPTTAGSADSTSGVTTSPPTACEDPQPVLQLGLDVPTGYEICADGRIHRVGPVMCQLPKPAGSCREGGVEGDCTSDADCMAQPFGTCVTFVGGPGFSCGCSYGCETDDDCPAGRACACAGDAPGYPTSTRCVPAACADTSECEDGLCRIGGHAHTCDPDYRHACTTAEDPCVFDEDCPDPVFESCHPLSGQWQCEFGDCA